MPRFTAFVLCLLAWLPAAGVAVAQAGPAWSHYPGFFSPGRDGIVIADLAGDGHRSAVVTGSTGNFFDDDDRVFLAVLSHASTGYDVRHVRALPDEHRFESAIRAFRRAGHPGDLIAAVTNHGIFDDERRLLVFEGPALEVIDEVVLPGGFRLTDLFDVDGDGELELIGVVAAQGNSGVPMVLDMATGDVEWSDDKLQVTDVGAGIIGAATRALVLSAVEGAPGIVLAGASREVLWSWPDGFHGRPVFGDFVAPDGVAEFAIIEDWGRTRLFRAAPTFSPLSDFESGEVAAHAVADVDGDGFDDLVLGAGQWGDITAYSPSDGSTPFRIPNPEHGVSALAVGDLDGLPGLQVVFGAGLTHSGVDMLTVVDAADGAVRYARGDEAGPHSNVVLVDGAGGRQELVFATAGSASGYAGSNIVVLDPDQGVVRRRRDSSGESAEWHWRGLSLAAANFDGDPQSELLAASGPLQFVQVRLLDAVTLETQWSSNPSGEGYVDAAIVVDANGDPVPDVAIALGGRLVLLDGRDGSELWRSTAVNVLGPVTLAARDAGEGPATHVALGVGQRVYVFDLGKRVISHFFEPTEDVIGQRYEHDGDGCRLVVVSKVKIDRRDCDTGAIASTRVLPLVATYVGFIDDSHGLLALSDGERVFIDEAGVVLRSSEAFDSNLGVGNRGAVRRNGSAVDVFIGGDLGVHRVALSLAQFVDGFE